MNETTFRKEQTMNAIDTLETDELPEEERILQVNYRQRLQNAVLLLQATVDDMQTSGMASEEPELLRSLLQTIEDIEAAGRLNPYGNF